MRELRILIVDDDAVDVQNIERALRRRGIGNPVYVARDGVEALDLLLGRGGHLPLGAPRLILLDLNMPRMDGFEFLAALRSHPDHEDDPVFVLTTSDDPHHEAEVQKYGISGYIVKDELPLRALDLVMQGLQQVPLAHVSTTEVGPLLRKVLGATDPAGRLVLDLPGIPLRFDTARARLETVFRTLFENALEHHDRANGRLRVTWVEEGRMVHFRVADDGPGIPESALRDVFKPLYSTKAASADPHAGTGMGLPLARQVVTAAGGSIRVEPGGGRGTTISFTWPLVWPEPEEVPSLAVLPIDDESALDPASLDAPEPMALGRADREEKTGGHLPVSDGAALDAFLAAAIEDATSEVQTAPQPELVTGPVLPPTLDFNRQADEPAAPRAAPPAPVAVLRDVGEEALPPLAADALAAFDDSDAVGLFDAPPLTPVAAEEPESEPVPRFEVSSPALAAFGEEASAAVDAAAPFGRSGFDTSLPFVVMMVDDDEVDAATLDRALRRRGHAESLLHAMDAEHALHLLQGAGGRTRLGPVVLLLDLSLPGQSGFDLLRTLRADDDLCGTPVFILSGSHDPTHRMLAMRLGACGFIDKDKVGPSFDVLVDLLEAYGRALSF